MQENRQKPQCHSVKRNLSFRGSDRCHCRGNPYSKRQRKRIAAPVCGLARNDTSSVNASRCHLPLKGKAGGFRALRARATFAPGGKSSQKRRLDLRSKNPLARGETFLAGNFPTRPRRFFRFFPRSEGLCQHSFPRGAAARRWLVPRWGFCVLSFLAIIKPRQSRPEGGFGRCTPGRGGTSANVSLRCR